MPSDSPAASLSDFFPFLKPITSLSKSRNPSPAPPAARTTPISSPRSAAFSLTPEPLPDLKHLSGYASSTATRLVDRSLAESIRVFMPARQQLHTTWTLVYSLEQHGASLSTLYERAGQAKKRGGSGLGSEGYVLVVKDLSGGTFGAFLNEALVVHEGRYFGNGECFLWRMEADSEGKENAEPEKRRRRGKFKVFPYTGANDYCIHCEYNGISVGGGDGKTGLYLDDRFETGVSVQCPTFENEILSDEDGGKFDILGVELWRIG